MQTVGAGESKDRDMEICECVAKVVSSLPENALHDGSCVSIEYQIGNESCKVQLRFQSNEISLQKIGDPINVFCVNKDLRQELNVWNFIIKLLDTVLKLAPYAAIIVLAYLAKSAIVGIMAK